MGLIVQKYGGTSVADLERIRDLGMDSVALTDHGTSHDARRLIDEDLVKALSHSQDRRVASHLVDLLGGLWDGIKGVAGSGGGKCRIHIPLV